MAYSTNGDGKKADKIFFDQYSNLSESAVPERPVESEWTVLRRDFRPFLWQSPLNFEPFVLFMDEVRAAMGSAVGVLVRADAAMDEFFYNKTETAFADTWVVAPRVRLRFAGEEPLAFRAGVRFGGAVMVSYDDFVHLGEEALAQSTIKITARAMMEDGAIKTIAEMQIPPKGEEEGQDDDEEITDKEELSSKWYSFLSSRAVAAEFRSSGFFRFGIDVPRGTQRLALRAVFDGGDGAAAEAEVRAYAARSSVNNTLQLSTSSARIVVGSFATFHLTAEEEVDFVDWMVLARDVVVASGREVAGNCIVGVPNMVYYNMSNLGKGL